MMKQTNFKDAESPPPRIKSQVGQDLVEFAVLITLFLVIVMAIFEFSAFFYFLSSLNAASRNAARYAIAENNLADCSGIEAAVNEKAIPIIGNFDDVTIKFNASGSFQCPGYPAEIIAGDEITVSVTSTYEPIISLFSFLGGEYTANSSRSVLVNLQISD